MAFRAFSSRKYFTCEIFHQFWNCLRQIWRCIEVFIRLLKPLRNHEMNKIGIFAIMSWILVNSACNTRNAHENTASHDEVIDSIKPLPDKEYLLQDTTYEFNPSIFDLNKAVLFRDGGYLFITGNKSPYWRNLDNFRSYTIEIPTRNIVDSNSFELRDSVLERMRVDADPEHSILTNTEAIKLNDSVFVSWVVTGQTVTDVTQVQSHQPEMYVNGMLVVRNEIPRYKETVNKEKSQYVGTLSFIKSSSEHLCKHKFRLTQFNPGPESWNVDNIVCHDGYLLIETKDDSLRLFNNIGEELLKVGDNNSRVKACNFYDFFRDEKNTYLLRTRINKSMQIVQFDNSNGQIVNSGTINCSLNMSNINSFAIINCDSNFLVSLYTQLILVDKNTFKVIWQKNLTEIGASVEHSGESDSWSAPVVYKDVVIQEFTTKLSSNLCVIDYGTGKVLKTYPYGPYNNEFGLKIFECSLFFIEQSNYSSRLHRIRLNI